MWSYTLIHKRTGEQLILFGYNEKDAFRRANEPVYRFDGTLYKEGAGLNPQDWTCVWSEYED